MNKKTSQTSNAATYEFSRTHRKWSFSAGSFTLLQTVKGPNGPVKTARLQRIANIVGGAVKNTKGKGLDGFARANIDRALTMANP